MENRGDQKIGSDDEIDLILDAAQQAWEHGETLLTWVERYPRYTEELTELALLVKQFKLDQQLIAQQNDE